MANVASQWDNGRTHTDQVANEIVSKWPIAYMWVLGPTGHHEAGRAVDFMTLTDDQRSLRTSMGNAIAAYLRSNAKRLGLQYVIWRRRIWNATRSDDATRVSWSSWRLMEDRGNTTANHMDHVHLSLLNSPPAYRSPDARSPSTSTARKVSLSQLVAAAKADPKRRQGGTTAGSANDVKVVEDALRREGFLRKSYASDGSFGTLTVRAYRLWQAKCGYRGRDADGIPGKASLIKLGKRYGFEVVE